MNQEVLTLVYVEFGRVIMVWDCMLMAVVFAVAVITEGVLVLGSS